MIEREGRTFAVTMVSMTVGEPSSQKHSFPRGEEKVQTTEMLKIDYIELNPNLPKNDEMKRIKAYIRNQRKEMQQEAINSLVSLANRGESISVEGGQIAERRSYQLLEGKVSSQELFKAAQQQLVEALDRSASDHQKIE